MTTLPHIEVAEAELVSDLAALPSAALVRSLKKVEEYRRHTTADATQEAYAVDWGRFKTWAETVGVAVLPASAAVVCAHLVWLAESKYSVATIERFLSGANHYHKVAGLDFPRNARIVADTLDGIRRKVGMEQTKKAPLGLRKLAEICERLGGSNVDELSVEERIANLRLRALLTLGWFCMLRSANLVSVRRQDVRLVRFEEDDWIDDEDRPDGVILHLSGSKTDQRKQGRDVAAHAQSDESVCPVRALVAYFRARRFASHDLIFPMSKRTVSRLIKRAVVNPAHGHKSLREVAQCGSCCVIANQFASHSLRRGAATTQAKKGVPGHEIMRQGGWKSERVMIGYIEYATLFENNATKDLTDGSNNLRALAREQVQQPTSEGTGMGEVDDDGSSEDGRWFLPDLVRRCMLSGLA